MANATRTEFDLCFSLLPTEENWRAAVPELVFHFDGADMEFPAVNYLHKDSVRGIVCLAFFPMKE